MIDYKKTLNLPKTTFPMRANLVQREPDMLARWNNDNLYALIRKAKKGKKKFILHDGPPYANGDIHIGHSINKILKDFIIKFKGLSGFDSPYVPGWDCHGLPIELKVEKEYGKPREKINASEFRERCREYASTQINRQRNDFMRLGVLGDWFSPYLTMDFKVEANIIRSLSKVIKNGHLYKGTKPVHWCIDCRSAMAEAEIEYHNKTSLSVYVIFEAADQEIFRKKFNLPLDVTNSISLLIWTTTPWSIPANRAIALSAESEYSFVLVQERILILASDLIEKVMKHVQISKYTILGIIKSTELELIRFKHPFFNYDVPIILGDYITLEAGTGAVHISGAHGIEDFNLSLKYGLDISSPVGPDGSYFPGTHKKLDGINLFQANEIVINLLRDNKMLLHIEKVQHNYPFCWRHKSPIIFRATPQWFISMDQKKLRNKSLEAIKKVQWIPNWTRERIESMVRNRPDWCISRQRIWGVPMSIFIHKETNEIHPRTLELMEEVAKRVEVEGIQAWWDLNSYDVMGSEASFYEKVSDTLDVWFDSGSTHTSVIRVRPEFNNRTADMYLEGIDQHRGWFMSSLLLSTAMNEQAPYNQVLTHGFAVDQKKHKMSKSIGNTISPQDIVNQFGADILRLWVASSDYTSEISVSNEILKGSVDNYRRIRNTARFLLANLHGFNPRKSMVKPEEMVALDRWAIGRTKSTQINILKDYISYDFCGVVQRLVRFCSIEMGSFYLDIIKDRQYTSRMGSLAHRSCQTALYHIAEALVRWISPIIPFTADEIWNHLPGSREKYVFTSEWYEKLFSLYKTEPMNDDFWNDIAKVREEVNKIIERERSDKKIGNSLELSVTLYAEPSLARKLNSLGEELRFVLLTSEAMVVNYIQATPTAQKGKLLKNLKIELQKARGHKCSRCWHYTTDVGHIVKYEEICLRCVENIVGDGEKRKFA